MQKLVAVSHTACAHEVLQNLGMRWAYRLGIRIAIDPLDTCISHACHHAEFCHCRSNCIGVAIRGS